MMRGVDRWVPTLFALVLFAVLGDLSNQFLVRNIFVVLELVIERLMLLEEISHSFRMSEDQLDGVAIHCRY